jgi:hypothetical protein
MRLERLQLFLVLTVGFISDLRLLPCKLRDVAMNTFFKIDTSVSSRHHLLGRVRSLSTISGIILGDLESAVEQIMLFKDQRRSWGTLPTKYIYTS